MKKSLQVFATIGFFALFVAGVVRADDVEADIEADIDAKPGSVYNDVNLNSGGTVNVLIKTDADFDALKVNLESVTMTVGACEGVFSPDFEIGNAPVYVNPDDDSDTDALLKFRLVDELVTCLAKYEDKTVRIEINGFLKDYNTEDEIEPQSFWGSDFLSPNFVGNKK